MNQDRRLLREALLGKLQLIATIALGFLAGGLVVAQAWLLSLVIAGVFLQGQGLEAVMSLLAALLAIAILRATMVWGSQVAARSLAVQVKLDLRQRLVSRILALGPVYTQGERSGELANTLVEGVEALDAYFSAYLPQLALAVLIPLTMLAVILPLDPLSGLVLLLTAPLLPLFMILIGQWAERLTRQQWTQLSRMSAHFLDVLQGLTTLKIFNRSRAQVRVIAQISQQFGDTTMSVLRIAFLSALVMEFLATLSVAIVAVEIGIRLLSGRIAFQQALFILILAPDFYIPLRLVGQRFHASMAGVAAADRIFQVLAQRETVLPTQPLVASPLSVSSAPPAIRFSGVSCTYPPPGETAASDRARSPALQGVSFDLPAGKVLALVGPSGAGKSTVANLLLRFIDPDQGTITVNGVPLSALPTAAWRELVSWVPQRPYLFNASVADNIALGHPLADEARVIQAARQAAAHNFIQRLPRGYDTILGERGARLSGGQAQRIALARAFLKDPPLLIMDEATANLDPALELVIQETTRRLVAGRTTLLIAHRIHTVVQADRIVVLDKGRVVQSGPHQELIGQDGLYRQLVGAYGGTP